MALLWAFGFRVSGASNFRLSWFLARAAKHRSGTLPRHAWTHLTWNLPSVATSANKDAEPKAIERWPRKAALAEAGPATVSGILFPPEPPTQVASYSSYRGLNNYLYYLGGSLI